jgi:hypothetical protein
MEKSLYQMPVGISEFAPEQEGLEIEIDIENGDEPAIEVEIRETGFDANLAEDMDEGDLQSISEEILDLIKTDINSRKEWERTYREGIDLLGLNIEDKDWLVINGSEQEMLEKGFIQVGKKFPVFLHPKTYEEYALARTEDKIDKGYKGFQFNTDDVSLVADLKRRDLTINAMAIDENGILHDPFNGQKDIIARKLQIGRAHV